MVVFCSVRQRGAGEENVRQRAAGGLSHSTSGGVREAAARGQMRRREVHQGAVGRHGSLRQSL